MEKTDQPNVPPPAEEHLGDNVDAKVREDVRWLVEIAREDAPALAKLYRRHSGLLYSMLCRMLENEMEAQEVLQDTFSHVWRCAHDYDAERSSPVAWMIMIARRRALDRLRARTRRKVGLAAYEREVVSLEMDVTSARQLELDELATVCASALNQLPDPEARALQLAFWRGWTHEEIASALGEPLGTVKGRIRRGLLALRKVLIDYHA